MGELREEIAALKRLGPCRSCDDTGYDRDTGAPCLCAAGRREVRQLYADHADRPHLAAKLAHGETPQGTLRNALTGLELVRGELEDLEPLDDLEQRRGLRRASEHLACSMLTIERVVRQLEER